MTWFRRNEVEENVQPCRHMEGLLHRASDGRLRGLAKWYAWSHAARCSGCLAFLRRLEAAALALQAARTSSKDEEGLSRLRSKVHELAQESGATTAD